MTWQRIWKLFGHITFWKILNLVLESIPLLKNLMLNGYQSKILPVDSKNIQYPIPSNHQVFVLNLHCNNSNLLLQKVKKVHNKINRYFNPNFTVSQVDGLKYLQSPFRWIFYHSFETETKVVADKFFSEINILVDSDATLCELKNNGTVQIKKLYKRRSNSSIDIEEMGFWTKSQGYSDYGFENTARRRGNLKGTQLNTCLVITNKDSLNHLTDKRH